jgi:hypothetical protein
MPCHSQSSRDLTVRLGAFKSKGAPLLSHPLHRYSITTVYCVCSKGRFVQLQLKAGRNRRLSPSCRPLSWDLSTLQRPFPRALRTVIYLTAGCDGTPEALFLNSSENSKTRVKTRVPGLAHKALAGAIRIRPTSPHTTHSTLIRSIAYQHLPYCES